MSYLRHKAPLPPLPSVYRFPNPPLSFTPSSPLRKFVKTTIFLFVGSHKGFPLKKFIFSTCNKNNSRLIVHSFSFISISSISSQVPFLIHLPVSSFLSGIYLCRLPSTFLQSHTHYTYLIILNNHSLFSRSIKYGLRNY